MWFVEFASDTDPAVIVAATAATLRVQPQPGMNTTEAVVNWLVGRRVLLILDNCEHVIDAARDLVDAIGRGCPTVSLLFASREPIGVEGERVHPVRSLTPSIEGVELFVARARLADASFVPTRDDGATIVSICERLDGIPLAIELAARIRSMAPVDVLARLTDRFRLLRGSGRGGIDRIQTLRAKVSWSYQLLTPSERTLLDRTSVFSSGFDLAVAEVA